LLRNDFQINFPLKGARERISTSNRRKRESQEALTLKLLVETPPGKLVADGGHGSIFYRKLPIRAVSNFVTVPVTLSHGTPAVAVRIQGAERIFIVD